jgi:hypothetical protein
MATIRKVSTVLCSDLKAGQIVMSLKSPNSTLFRLILLQNSYKIVWMDSLGTIYQTDQLWRHFAYTDYDNLIIEP